MRYTAAVMAIGSVVLCSACMAKSERGGAAASPPVATVEQAAGGEGRGAGPAAAVVQRKIIRTAELSLEADDPVAAERSATELIERLGGYVVGSDVMRGPLSDDDGWLSVSLVARVPSARFDEALAGLRALAVRVPREKVGGQDVTEEYVDVQARLATQRALETQYLAIAQQAKSVPDLLAVQKQLAEVRGEIEKLEGRSKFLDDKVALSTISVAIGRRTEAAATGFGATFRQAGRDAVDVTLGIAHGAIRAVGIFLPIGILLGAPLYLIARWLWRRRRARANTPRAV